MSSAFPISSGSKASEIESASYDAPLEPALELLRQGNKLASQEQFSDADRVFRAAASLPGGKAIWSFKSLGFCPTVFSDASSVDAFWQQLDQGLDQVLATGIGRTDRFAHHIFRRFSL